MNSKTSKNIYPAISMYTADNNDDLLEAESWIRKSDKNGVWYLIRVLIGTRKSTSLSETVRESAIRLTQACESGLEKADIKQTLENGMVKIEVDENQED